MCTNNLYDKLMSSTMKYKSDNMDFINVLRNLKRNDCIIFMTNGMLREGIVVCNYSPGDKYLNVSLRGDEFKGEMSDIFINAISNLRKIDIRQFTQIRIENDIIDIRPTNRIPAFKAVYDTDNNGYSYIDNEYSLIKQFNGKDPFSENISYFDKQEKYIKNEWMKRYDKVFINNIYGLSSIPYQIEIDTNNDDPILLRSIGTHLCPMEVIENFLV